MLYCILYLHGALLHRGHGGGVGFLVPEDDGEQCEGDADHDAQVDTETQGGSTAHPPDRKVVPVSMQQTTR